MRPDQSFQTYQKFTLLLSFFIFLPFFGQTQSVGINTTGAAPDPSAMLDVSATDKGVLIPRVELNDVTTQAPITAAPVEGLLIYNTSGSEPAGYYYWDGAQWVKVATGSGGINSSFTLNGTTLDITDPGGTLSADLSPVLDSTDNDSVIGNETISNLNLTGSNILEIDEAGNTFTQDLSSLIDDADADPTNEYNNSLTLNGTTLELDDPGGTLYQDLSSLTDTGYWDRDAGNGYLYPSTLTDNVGIGTNSPDAELHVVQSNGGTIDDRGGYVGALIGSGANGAAHYSHADVSSRLAAHAVTDGSADYVALNGHSTVWIGTRGETRLQQNNVSGVVGVAEMNGGAYDANGVSGIANAAAGYGIGVLGDGDYYGVFANGDVGATGTKPFTIDHPSDPSNKILRHFAMESNKVLNVYSGTVTLDGDGEAKVELPDYYQKINKNPSYQLTPIGSAMPELHVGEGIDGGRSFVIAGGEPGEKVSWEVKAERNDPYLRQNPEKRRVVMDKKDYMKGKYFMPELYGKPEGAGIFHGVANMKNPDAR